MADKNQYSKAVSEAIGDESLQKKALQIMSGNTDFYMNLLSWLFDAKRDEVK